MEQRKYGSVPVVLLLDISNIVKGEAFSQMKEAFVSLIMGYANQPLVTHKVAVISFGREVNIVQNFSEDYNTILHLLDDTVCEGPSQFGKALELALDVLRDRENRGLVGPFSIRRLVIMSGGHAINKDSTEDIENERNEKMSILQLVGKIRKAFHIVCVPVGRDPDMCFLGSIAYSSKSGKLLKVDEAAQFARFSTNMVIASKIIGKMPTVDYSLDDVTAAVLSIGGGGSITETDLKLLFTCIRTRSKYNKKGFASAASNIRNPRDVNKKNTEICEKDKMAEGGKRNSSPVQHKMEGLGGKNALNCNFSDRPCPWEWKTNQGKWVSFPKSENDKIQNAFDKNRKGTVLVKIDEDLYRVVLSKMIQINISNRESLEIRRLS
eukprot:XP_019929575.1 PREDICTED: uncharacterized protein LOC105344991 [Crassostrea gigas]